MLQETIRKETLFALETFVFPSKHLKAKDYSILKCILKLVFPHWLFDMVNGMVFIHTQKSVILIRHGFFYLLRLCIHLVSFQEPCKPFHPPSKSKADGRRCISAKQFLENWNMQRKHPPPHGLQFEHFSITYENIERNCTFSTICHLVRNAQTLLSRADITLLDHWLLADSVMHFRTSLNFTCSDNLIFLHPGWKALNLTVKLLKPSWVLELEVASWIVQELHNKSWDTLLSRSFSSL